jgi:lysophospholipase L1-like esterase
VLWSAFVSRPRSLFLVLLLASLSACGGGSSGPTPVQPTFSVAGAVFYDENGNGLLDPSENTRIPDVVVEIAGRTGRTSKVLGEFTVEGVAGGTQALTLRRGSLPPYYLPPAPVSIGVPTSQPVLIPVTLPIGSNRPNVYMGFGDSITIGQGSSDERGYRGRLEEKLAAHFGRGAVVNEGMDATRSNRGADRIDDSLRRARPAYTLILYGTNDWNVAACKNDPPCFTIDSLRDIALSARGSSSLPILSTIIPGDPTSTDQPARNQWVSDTDVRIRALAREMNVPLADPEPLFLKAPNFESMYVDHVHPNDSGYELIAQAFFTAIVMPTTTATSVSAPVLFARPTSLQPARTTARPAIVGAGSRE